ncbi:MAG: Fic family protein [Solobacterium sp.]|nr:Fic family protein [Solobacterium sp.]
MNREKLYQHLEQHYVSKREMISRLPLDVQPDEIWQDVLNRRRVRSIMLPIHSPRGNPYWYVTTQKMASASYRIISEMMENETEFDPYRNLPAATCLEESFFTSYVEGSQLTMQDAMAFIQGDMEPQSAEEQLILNNRNALNFISSNLYRPVSEEFINTVAGFLNENMEIGGEGYRSTDFADIPSMTGLAYEVPKAFMIPDSVREISLLIADPTIHPLIKAAVSHAWALAVRPFPDANERLGRILSQFICDRQQLEDALKRYFHRIPRAW